MTPQEVLDKAADLLEETGWCRNWYELRGRHCARGAINTIANGDPNRTWGAEARLACELLTAHLESRVGSEFLGIQDWNDHQARDGRQVVREMRAAAKS